MGAPSTLHPVTMYRCSGARTMTATDSRPGRTRTERWRIRRLTGSVLALDHEVRASDGPRQVRLLACELERAQLGGDVHPFGELESDGPLRIRSVERVQDVDREPALVEPGNILPAPTSSDWPTSRSPSDRCSSRLRSMSAICRTRWAADNQAGMNVTRLLKERQGRHVAS
jgi:hypothetical protein